MSLFGDPLVDELYAALQALIADRGMGGMLKALGRVLSWLAED